MFYKILFFYVVCYILILYRPTSHDLTDLRYFIIAEGSSIFDPNMGNNEPPLSNLSCGAVANFYICYREGGGLPSDNFSDDGPF